jgi:hypothetical protein
MDDLPNPRRGQAILEIGEDRYLIEYNFDNLVELQKSLKMNVQQIIQAISCLDVDVLSRVAYSGITEGKAWPDRFGKKPPIFRDVRKSMSFADIEKYIEQVLEALRGAEAIADTKKKAEAVEDQDDL